MCQPPGGAGQREQGQRVVRSAPQRVRQGGEGQIDVGVLSCFLQSGAPEVEGRLNGGSLPELPGENVQQCPRARIAVRVEGMAEARRSSMTAGGLPQRDPRALALRVREQIVRRQRGQSVPPPLKGAQGRERGVVRARSPAGRDAHRTRAGIHADGLNKFWPVYAPFDVPRLLGRPLDLSLTADSGLAGLIFLIKQNTGTELAKEHAGLRALHTGLSAKFAGGRQTAVEWEKIEARARTLL